MKKIICILLIVIMGIVGCGKKEKISVVTNKIQENMEDKKVFTSHQLEIPFDRNTLELDYIAEEGIGVLTNTEGDMELFTLTRSVKKKYRKKASELIKEKKQLTADMLECRIWKFVLDEDERWQRQVVSENALFDEEDVVNESAKYVKYEPVYDMNGNFMIIVSFDKEDENGQENYIQWVYQLANKKWGYLGEYSYVEKDNSIQEPLRYAVDCQKNLIVAKIDGSVSKYDLELKKEIDISTDFSFDLSEMVFSTEMGYSRKEEDNTIVSFYMDDFVQDKVIKMPEKSSSGPEILAVNQKQDVVLINSTGIFEMGENDVMKKVSSKDMISGVEIDKVVFDYACIDKDGAIYLYMYDYSDESRTPFFYKIEEVKK